MRLAIISGAIVVATAACGSAAATATGHCGPAGAKTLVIDSVARVYTSAGSVYGCSASGHRYRLGSSQRHPGQPAIGKAALAGVDVAYGATTFGVDTSGASVTVRRLDTGRTVRRKSAMNGPVGPEAFQSVEGLVVKSDGAVAWIAQANSVVSHRSQIEVDRVDERGGATLDTGSGIDTSSLRLHGSRLSWRHSGAVRTATLS